MQTARLSSKGQFILPKPIRDRHCWGPGTEFVIIERDSEIVLRPTRMFPPSELESPDAPSVYRGKTLSLDDMRAAVEDEAKKHK